MRTVIGLCTILPLGLLLLAPPARAADLAALRTKARDFLAPLPERMPGAEHDTPARVALGQKLYFDPLLSQNRSQSCNTCHRLDEGRGGVDNEPTSPGAFSKRGDRNSPTVLNAGFQFKQFWDGRAATLEEQAKGPVLNPVEMAMPNETEVLQRLQASAEYPPLFAKAFPDAAQPVSYDRMAQAIAAFERTLITHDRFDDFLKGQDDALTPAELGGLDLFLTIGCTTCHHGPVLGGNSFQKLGLLHPYPDAQDLGLASVTKEEDDNYRFKVPMLRNIALTGPYFHNGKLATLPDAAKLMAHLQLDRQLTEPETSSLVAFFRTLTDKPRVK